VVRSRSVTQEVAVRSVSPPISPGQAAHPERWGQGFALWQKGKTSDEDKREVQISQHKRVGRAIR